MDNSHMVYGVASLLMGVVLAVGSSDAPFLNTLLLLVGIALTLLGVVWVIKGLRENVQDAKAERRSQEASAIHQAGDEELDRQIRALKQKMTICWALFFALVLGLFVQAGMEIATPPTVIANLAAAAVVLMIPGRLGRKLKDLISGTVLQEVLEQTFTNVEHSPDGRIPEGPIRGGDMGLPEFEESRGEDLIKAAYKGLSFSMCDLDLRRSVTTTDDEGKESTSLESILRGTMLVCELDRALPTTVRLWPDYLSARNGVWTSDMAFREGFHVEADDEAQAARVVTPAMLDRLSALRREHRLGLHLRFDRSGQVCVVIRDGQDHFEAGKGKKMEAAVMRRRFTQELEPITELLDVLLMYRG